jgi:hypothetical protein|tara:strand:- start:91181 stop:91351 length:171 start_codon:yes stop_codon:yes gene_type:complete
MSKWKVLVNEELRTISSTSESDQEQYRDIKKQIHRSMGVNKKTRSRPDIHIINKII